MPKLHPATASLPSRNFSKRLPHELTAFGFPTIHPNYPHAEGDKGGVRESAGIPGQYCGTRTEIIENDRLVAPRNILQKTFITYKQKQGFGAKYDAGAKDSSQVPHERGAAKMDSTDT